jgi:hypothetical protein
MVVPLGGLQGVPLGGLVMPLGGLIVPFVGSKMPLGGPTLAFDHSIRTQ